MELREREQQEKQPMLSLSFSYLAPAGVLGAQEENQERAVLAGKAEVLHHHTCPASLLLPCQPVPPGEAPGKHKAVK